MKTKSRLLFASLITVAFASQLHAAQKTWTNGGDGLWSNAANWGGAIPAVNDTLVFGITTSSTTLIHDLPNTYLWSAGASVINATNFRTTGITFNSDAPAYTINGTGTGSTTLTIDGTITVNSASNITQTINSALSGTGGPTVAGAGNLTLTGGIAKLGTYNPGLTMNGTGVLTLSGAATMKNSDSSTPYRFNSGTVVLAKSAAGAFNPAGVIINGGATQLAAAEQFRSAGYLTMNGGTLDLNGFDSALGGNGAVVADGLGSGVNHNGGLTQLTGLGGRITNNAAGTGTNWLVINQNGGQQASYGGTISDGATAKVGVTVVANYNQAAFQALAGNNTYSGGTFIQHNYTGSGGRPETLSIANVASIGSSGSRNLTFKGGAADANVILQLTGTAVTNSNQFNALTFTSGQGAGLDIADPNNTFTLGKNAGGTDITLTGAAVFEKLGAGTLEVKSALAYTSHTYLGGGTLKIDAQNGGALPSTSLPVMSGGNLYLLGASSGSTTQTMGGLSMASLNNYGGNSGGASMITVDANGGAGTTLALGTITNSTSAGYSLNIKTLTGGQVSTTTTTTTNGLIGNGRIVFTDASNVVDFASIPGSGTRYIQAASYTPGLPATDSDLNTNYSQADNATVTASESVNALKLTTSTTGQSLAITSGQTLTLTTGGLLFTGADAYSITGGTLNSNTSSNSDLIVHQYGADLTVSSEIANGLGASTLTKAGTGTLTLSGANTYGGATYVTGGILSISSDSNIGGANGTFANLTSATNSTSVASTAASLPTGFAVGSTMLGRTVNAIGGTSGAYTITLSGNANTALSGGEASWARASALNLYSGGVLQANGNITLQESNAGGAAGTTTVNRTVTIGNSGGGFDVTTGNTLTITGGIGATGMMTKSGEGTLTLSAANNLTGGLTITDGTLKLNIANALTQNSGTATSSLIFGSGTAPKLQLNNYDAAVTSLVASNTNAIVENGSATVGTKTLTVSNGADNTYAGILQNGGTGKLALAKSGGGTLTLSNAGNTFNGGITIYNGVVTGNLGTGTVTLANGTLQAAGTLTNAVASSAGVSGAAVSYQNTIDTSAGDVSFSGVFSGSGALNKTGANTLTFGNAANTYTGSLTATTGTVSFASMGATAGLVLAGGNFTSTGTTTVGSLAVNTSGGNISAPTGALTINSLVGTGTFNAIGVQYGSYVRLTGNNTGFSGSINASGKFVLNNEEALGTNTNALTFNGGEFLDNGTTLTVANHRITLAASIEAGGSMVLNGGITGAGGITVRSYTNGAIVIGGTNNDYTGPTSIYTDSVNNSTLRLGANNALPYGAGKGNLDLRAWAAGIATLDMGGYSQTVNGLHHINASGANTVIDNVTAGGNVTLTVGANNATGYTFAGVITDTTGTLNLEKTGTGTQTLSGSNSYSGDTTVSAGTLTLSNAPAPANANTGNDASTVTIASSGATLNLTFTGTDVVDKLFIGASQKAVGTYGHTNSGATNGGLGVGAMDAYFGPGTGTLTVASGPGGANYSTWASTNGTAQTANLDHDNDGVSNGVEYFIGGPTGNTTGFTPLPSVTTLAGVRSVTWVKGPGYTGVYNTDFIVETSTTLAAGSWTTEASPGNVVITGDNVTYTFPAGPVKTFARLRVTGP